MMDDVMIVGVDMLDDMGVIVMVTPVIALGFLIGIVYAVEVPDDQLSNLLNVLIIDVLTAIDVDMLTDENVNGLVAVMTPLEFTMPTLSEESMPCCLTAFSR